ncbi:MAG: zinc ribbon domain-containing protein [Solirubrobacteraceae bacterium]
MSLAPVPSEQPDAASSCANCSAPLAPDQRYCLACGQPVSPVRLAFLDVLQADAQSYSVAQAPVGALPPGYASVIEPTSGATWTLRRYSGLFGLLSVLLLAIVAGLLIGHWATQSSAPSRQVVRVEGLGALAAAPAAAASTTPVSATEATTPTSTTSTKSSKAAAKTEAHDVQEAKVIEKAPPPKAVKVTPTKLKKLGSSTGKKHEEEVNSLGAQPIETGG